MTALDELIAVKQDEAKKKLIEYHKALALVRELKRIKGECK